MRIYKIVDDFDGELEIFFTSEDAAKEYCEKLNKQAFDEAYANAEKVFEQAMERYREEAHTVAILTAASEASIAAATEKADELGVSLPPEFQVAMGGFRRFTPREPKREHYPALNPDTFWTIFSYNTIETED